MHRLENICEISTFLRDFRGYLLERRFVSYNHCIVLKKLSGGFLEI
jgi:hypothetical protein